MGDKIWHRKKKATTGSDGPGKVSSGEGPVIHRSLSENRAPARLRFRIRTTAERKKKSTRATGSKGPGDNFSQRPSYLVEHSRAWVSEIRHKLGATVEANDVGQSESCVRVASILFFKIRIVPLCTMKLRLQVWVKWPKKGQVG